MDAPSQNIGKVNAMTQAEFVAAFGPLFEHSPWVASETWKLRPFSSRDDLSSKLMITLRRSPLERKIKLIQAHPDLAGRLAATGQLTAASKQEQAGAGLDRLTAEEAGLFAQYNEAYRAKFGFPFVICARLSDKHHMLDAFQHRLELSIPEEIETAIGEIEKIGALRLAQQIPA